MRWLRTNRLLRHNVIYMGGTLTAGALGYVFHFGAGRLLGPAGYAVVASAVAALYILNLPALVVQLVSARFTGVAVGRAQLGNVPDLLLQVSGLGLAIGLVISATLLLFRGPIAAYLQIADQRVIGLLAAASLVFLLVSATRGALQGLSRFAALSVNVVLDMAVRVASLAALVLAGLGALGGVVALIVGPAVSYLQSLFLFRGMRAGTTGDRASLGQVSRYAVLAAFGAIGTTYLYNIDVLLAKHYLAAEAAGIYAASSVLGRVVYFLGVTIAQVMFPEVASRHAKDEPHFHVVDLSLAMMAAMVVGLTVVYAFVPGLVVLPFGRAFDPVQPYLWRFALALGLLSVSNVLINYFLSIGSGRFAVPLLGACLLESVLIVAFHSSAGQILGVILGAMAFLTVALGAMYAVERLGTSTGLKAQQIESR